MTGCHNTRCKYWCHVKRNCAFPVIGFIFVADMGAGFLDLFSFLYSKGSQCDV